MLKNIFGDMSLDTSIRSILRKLASLSFDNTAQLRVSGSITSGTVTTVATVTTGNIGIGDCGKVGTAILMSQMNCRGLYNNFIRS